MREEEGRREGGEMMDDKRRGEKREERKIPEGSWKFCRINITLEEYSLTLPPPLSLSKGYM